MKYKGSSLVCVVLVLAVLTVYLTSLMRTAQLSVEFAHNRTASIKYQTVATSLHDYCSTWIADNFDTLVQDLGQTKKIVKKIIWPPDVDEKEQWLVMLTSAKDDICLTVRRMGSNKSTALSSLIHKKSVNGETEFFIEPCKQPKELT